jgi:hypothetical protein
VAARRSFGRFDSLNDARALALGLKSKRASELDQRFCAELAPFLEQCGLRLARLEG